MTSKDMKMKLHLLEIDHQVEALQRGEAARNHILVMKELKGDTDLRVKLEENYFYDYTYNITFYTLNKQEIYISVCCETGYLSFIKNDSLIFKIHMYNEY